MSASIYWIFKCHKNKKNILFYHYIIVFLLLSTFFESILLFLYYEILNFSVASHSALKTVSKLMLIGRKMLSRMVVLLICSGVGITKETISTNEKKSAASFFALFFIFSLFNEVQKNSFGYKSEIVAFVYSVLSLMDVLLYAWAYYKLFLVLRRIGKNNKFKYSVYLKLTVLTIFGCLASVVFCTAEIIFVSSRKYTEVANWHYFLFYDVGFWEILFMYFICVVMKVLSPEIEISKYTQIENNAGDIEEHIEEKTKRLLSGSDNLSSFSDSEEEDVQKDVDLAADSTKSDDNGDDKSNKDIESEKKNENNQIDNDKTNDNDTKLKDFNINNDQTDEKTNVDETEKKINVDETDQKNIQKENKSTKN
ncbi:hypothetical protein MHBO_002088 [Bonamia ostreae]|uniref:GOST seven transmembrane domain-containing protein n=1 Tax=Bonamia ostreae TaxID=126728 RepID=A0ABV2ALA9_9EUKA